MKRDRNKEIAENLILVRERIEQAADSAGRKPEDITLVAVGKTKPVQDLEAALAAGQVDFGENYVQELVSKVEALGPGPRFHMIGHLQRNKVRHLVGKVHLIHTLDSERLARELERRASWNGVSVKVLIEVNLAGEANKSGIPPAELEPLLDKTCGMEHLQVVGLMTVPPFLPPEEVRPFFRQLRKLLSKAQSIAGPGLRELSMGMSNDFEVAIQEGATMVRIGTAIFGARR